MTIDQIVEVFSMTPIGSQQNMLATRQPPKSIADGAHLIELSTGYAIFRVSKVRESESHSVVSWAEHHETEITAAARYPGYLGTVRVAADFDFDFIFDNDVEVGGTYFIFDNDDEAVHFKLKHL